jgi:hypothetical protein
MLLHVVVHLLLFVASLAVLALVVLALVQIPFALLIDLVFKFLVFKQEVLFVSIMLIKLSLLFWGQLLSEVMPSRLGQRDYPSFLLSRPLTNLGIVAGCFHASSYHLLLLPILDLHSLTLLIKMVMQEKGSRKLFLLLPLKLLRNLLVLLDLDLHLGQVLAWLLRSASLSILARSLLDTWGLAFFLWRFLLVS